MTEKHVTVVPPLAPLHVACTWPEVFIMYVIAELEIPDPVIVTSRDWLVGHVYGLA